MTQQLLEQARHHLILLCPDKRSDKSGCEEISELIEYIEAELAKPQEPVATLYIGGVTDNELDDNDLEPRTKAIEALELELVEKRGLTNGVAIDLFASPQPSKGELPPLPEPVSNVSASTPLSGIGFVKPDKNYYTADQMRDYASAAIAAISAPASDNSHQLAHEFAPGSVSQADKSLIPINAHIWAREATNEWVLELYGVLNDVNFTALHTVPISTKLEDVPSLLPLYEHADKSAEMLEALTEARRAIGNHFAPNDCYATGPLTGNEFRDFVECPACSFIAIHDDVMAKIANHLKIREIMSKTKSLNAAYEGVGKRLAKLEQQNKELKEALRAALIWIDAIPNNTHLPSMPGFDRDWVEGLLEIDNASSDNKATRQTDCKNYPACGCAVPCDCISDKDDQGGGK